MKIESLDSIGLRYGTDKASAHPTIKGHNYCHHYDRVFSRIRASASKVLEIGVGGAESMKMWLDYFPYAKVHGVDIVHDTNPWNTPGGNAADPRYTFTQGDQSCETFWACFIANHGKEWDVICDDGSHISKDIITSFKMLWPVVRSGGFYCIEDLNCSYSGISHFLPEGWPTHMQFISSLMDSANRREQEIEMINYSCELAIIQKK